jgi:Zn-dependent peptidase ImmA (M78 family)
MKVDFNVHILEALITQNRNRAVTIGNRFPKIEKWKQSADKPTLKQLIGLANYFSVPFGYFFLKEIPKKIYPIPHYRSTNKGTFKPSQELLKTIEIVKERQDWARDMLKGFREPLSFAKTISTNTKIELAAQKVRDTLKLTDKWVSDVSIGAWEDAFRFLVRKAEEAGIFVVVNGVVNNDPTKKLNLNEFRGFVLYDDYAPFIFINNKDFVTGKIFTIIHEIVHLLIGKSASFDFVNLIPADNDIEEFCNAVAAEFLVPQHLISGEFEKSGANYDKLSRQFKVSRMVIARRLLDTGKISKREFITAYNSFRVSNIEKSSIKSSGGNFYNTAPYRISRSFFNLVYGTVKQDKMLYRDAFKLTGLTPKSFDGYVKKHIG